MSVYRFNPHATFDPSSDPADWTNDVERSQIVIRNVLMLHSRGWSYRAIAEDLFGDVKVETGRARVERIVRRWRQGVPVVAMSTTPP